MSDRQQQVVVSETVSTKINVNMGLPQGIVVEPLLFILYINDTKSCVNHARIRFLADNALLMAAYRNIENAIVKMHEECENELKLNINKTKFMILTRNHVIRDEYLLKIRNNSIQKLKI